MFSFAAPTLVDFTFPVAFKVTLSQSGPVDPGCDFNTYFKNTVDQTATNYVNANDASERYRGGVGVTGAATVGTVTGTEVGESW